MSMVWCTWGKVFDNIDFLLEEETGKKRTRSQPGNPKFTDNYWSVYEAFLFFWYLGLSHNRLFFPFAATVLFRQSQEREKEKEITSINAQCRTSVLLFNSKILPTRRPQQPTTRSPRNMMTMTATTTTLPAICTWKEGPIPGIVLKKKPV